MTAGHTRNSGVLPICRSSSKLSDIRRSQAIHFELGMLHHFVILKLTLEDPAVLESDHTLKTQKHHEI